MAESVHEQIAAAIQTSLGGIVGDAGATYWSTPGLVARDNWEDPDRAAKILDSTIVGPIYTIRPGEEDHEESVGQVVNAKMDVYILVASVFSTVDPATPSRATVVNRMVRDVLRKLLADVMLLSVGGAVDNVFDGPVIVDRERWYPGWVVAEIHFRTAYRYVGGVP